MLLTQNATSCSCITFWPIEASFSVEKVFSLQPIPLCEGVEHHFKVATTVEKEALTPSNKTPIVFLHCVARFGWLNNFCIGYSLLS